MDSSGSLKKQRSSNATKMVVAMFGVLIGFAGVEHGIFEVLQGNTAPEGIFVDAIGPNWKFWEEASEPTLTLIPNFFVTGLVAITLGVIMIIWSTKFMERRHGTTIFFLIGIGLFLFGGGFAPIFLTLHASAAATRINQPLNWWKAHLPGKGGFAKAYPAILIVYAAIFFIAVGMQIIGSPFDVAMTTNLVWVFALAMLVMLPITVIIGFAYDAIKLQK
jgi:hypothetical protein